MNTIVNLYSQEKGEIARFLSKYYNKEIQLQSHLKWENIYPNPIELADIIGAFIENSDQFKIAMWISLDEGTFIYVSDSNADSIIRYLYERYPS